MLKPIIRFFYLLFHRQERTIEKINKKLEKAVRKEIKDRWKLKKEINKFVKKKYGVSISEYIPRKGHNRMEIFASVLMAYGEKMEALNLTLRRNLTWKK